MLLYNIGYTSYEESEFVQMSHEEKLSNEQLEQMVHQATIKALEYAINLAEDEISRWEIEGRRPKLEEHFYFDEEGISFQRLFPRIVKELEKAGFTRIDFEAVYSIFGWDSVCEARRSGINARLRDAIPKDLRNRAVKIREKKDELRSKDPQKGAAKK